MYVGSVLGSGILVAPAIAANIAGPASIVAWIALSLVSYPIAYTFAAGFIAVYIFGSASAVKLLKLNGLKQIFPYLTLIVSVVAFSFVGKFALFPLAVIMAAVVWIRRTKSKIRF